MCPTAGWLDEPLCAPKLGSPRPCTPLPLMKDVSDQAMAHLREQDER
jgi:hypothetical protein